MNQGRSAVILCKLYKLRTCVINVKTKRAWWQGLDESREIGLLLFCENCINSELVSSTLKPKGRWINGDRFAAILWNLYKLRTCVINVKTKRAIKNDQNFIWTISLLFYTDSRSHVSQKLWIILTQNVKKSNLKKIVDTKKALFFQAFHVCHGLVHTLETKEQSRTASRCTMPTSWMDGKFVG
jgi:hypothetical protein